MALLSVGVVERCFFSYSISATRLLNSLPTRSCERCRFFSFAEESCKCEGTRPSLLSSVIWRVVGTLFFFVMTRLADAGPFSFFATMWSPYALWFDPFNGALIFDLRWSRLSRGKAGLKRFSEQPRVKSLPGISQQCTSFFPLFKVVPSFLPPHSIDALAFFFFDKRVFCFLAHNVVTAVFSPFPSRLASQTHFCRIR